MASPYKMKNSMLKMAVNGGPMQENYAGSPLADNDKVATKTQTLQGRAMYPGDSKFEGSEKSSEDQSLGTLGSKTKSKKNYTNFPANKYDATESTVKGGKTIFGGDKTVVVKDTGGKYNSISKTTTKSRKDKSKKKVIEFSKLPGGKTHKTVTRYKKDGTVKGKPKSRVVRSNNLFTGKSKVSHSKNNQELVDKATTTYIKGNANINRSR